MPPGHGEAESQVPMDGKSPRLVGCPNPFSTYNLNLINVWAGYPHHDLARCSSTGLSRSDACQSRVEGEQALGVGVQPGGGDRLTPRRSCDQAMVVASHFDSVVAIRSD